jgi:hypothetical protein
MPMWWGMSGFYNGLASETPRRERPQSEIKTRTLEQQGRLPALQEGHRTRGQWKKART